MLWVLFLCLHTPTWALDITDDDDTGTNVEAVWADMAPQGEEVLLTFRYRGVGNVYITALYDYAVDQMYLPVSELFSLLQIYYEISPGDFTLAGNYLTPDQPFRIFFNQQQVILADRAYTFTADDFRVGELDLYASPRIFEEIFGLFFTINLNNLSMSLETQFTMPVEERAERDRARQLVEAREVTREFYPLRHERQRRVLGMGFADYNITGNFSQDNPNMNYSITGGMEVLGGDVQGSVFGSWAGEEHTIRASNLRWRYVIRDNPWFSSFSAGQLSTTGLQARSIRGAAISNDPIEPRRIYESYIVDGSTEPDSEVELYLNNRLIDFSRADEAGYYRFEFPLTYGTTQLTINIYTPTGELRTIDRRIQIPFTFLPKGEVAYHLQGGYTETFLGETAQERLLIHGDVAMGVTGWLTAKIGSEYIEDFNEDRPFTYGSLSARLLSQYLVNVDVAPNAFYRGIASVMYPNGRSLNVQFTHYDGSSVFNTGGADQDIIASFYTPFSLFNIPMGFRLGGDHRFFGPNSMTRFRSDLNMRLGRMNVRFNYRDVLLYSDNEYALGQGQLAGSLTYTFQRSAGIPVFVRGMFIRGNITYNTQLESIEQADFQLSRSIRQLSRINLQAGYDFRSEQHYVRLGFIMDLNSMRTSTNVDVSNNRAVVRQNFRGSLGFDRNPDRIVTSNRNQVGRAGASVILFVDNNNSGTFDEGDEIIPARAIRLDRSAQMQVGRDGVIRVSQLQSYFQYNMEIIRGALPNPLLAPAIDRFSFVADPNQYKRIEIPFYRTGVIDGRVYFERADGQRRSQGGLRLMITGLDNEFTDMVRNFSDGSYYAMDMPPGQYTIEVDPTQLDFLDALMPEGPVTFEVRALAEGDFVEDLDIIIMPRPDVEEPVIAEVLPADTITLPDTLVAAAMAEPELITEPPLSAEDRITAFPSAYYSIQVGIYPMEHFAENARNTAEDITNTSFHIRQHDRYDLFIVYSEPFGDRSQAGNLLDILTESGFNDAFVRGVEATPPADHTVAEVMDQLPFEEAPVGDQYYVVLNYFSTIYRAEAARLYASQNIHTNFLIRYEEEEGLFKVYTGLYSNPLEANDLLNRMLASGFNLAWVEYASPPGPEPIKFQVQIGSYATVELASEALNTGLQQLSMSLMVEFDAFSERYALRTMPFETIPEASEALRRIQQNENYRASFVVSRPRLSNIPIIHTN